MGWSLRSASPDVPDTGCTTDRLRGMSQHDDGSDEPNEAVIWTARLAERPHVAELVLDRPQAMGAISTAVAQGIRQGCADLAGDPDVRAVVLRSSAERAFCVGADLKERIGFDDEEMRAQRAEFHVAFAAVRDLPVPIVAAVHGFALGGGCELALSCDVVVADTTAVFGLPEVQVGLVPGGGGTQLLARRVGSGRASEMILTGRRVPAEEAASIGLAEHVVPEGQATDEALAVASAIAANSPTAVRGARRAIRDGLDLPLDQGLGAEDREWEEAAFFVDRREGIAAFAEKRTPRWAAPGDLT